MKRFSMDKCLAITAIITTILLVMPLMFHQAMADEAQPTTMYVIGVKTWLNGREKPNTQSIVEARFPLGTDVAVYEVSGQWAKVAGGECGYVWCYMDYLTSEKPNEDSNEQESSSLHASQTYTVTSNGRVNVRDTPDMDGGHVRWLENGDAINVQSWFDGWAYIGDGYVLGKYIIEAVDDE